VISSNSLLAQWRADTPGCLHRNHLNNAGAALMPRSVIDAITGHIQLEGEIGGYEAEAAREQAIESVYNEIGALVGAPARNMAIVANATAGFIQSMSAFDLTRGDIILTSNVDYVSYQISFSTHRISQKEASILTLFDRCSGVNALGSYMCHGCRPTQELSRTWFPSAQSAPRPACPSCWMHVKRLGKYRSMSPISSVTISQ
jgi:hypothetical protein